MSFDFYRRRQREVLAILVLVAIFSFIVVPSLQMYQSDQAYRSSDAAQRVVQWRGGEIRRDELSRMVMTQGQTVNFLSQVAQEVIKRKGMPNVPGFSYDFQNNQIRSLGISGFVSEVAAIRTRLLAEKAKRLGIVFDDQSVDGFLKDFINSKLTDAEIKDLMEKVSGGQLTRFRLYQQLKNELAAFTMERTSLAGLNSSLRPIMTPGQNWQYFERLNRQIRIEAIPILVSDYVAQVTEQPTEMEIVRLYEDYKDQFSSPTSSEPGFRKRYATDMEVVEISIEPFVEREVAKLPEDQIKAEYQRRVEQGQYRRPSAAAGTAPPVTPAPETNPEPTATPETPAATPPADKPAEPAPSDKPAEDKPAADKPADAPAAETPAPPAETPAAPEAPAKPEGDNPPKAASLPASSSAQRTRLVAFQKPADAPAKPDEQEAAAAKPADEKPAEEKPTEPAATPAETTPAPQPPAADAAAATPATAPPPVEQPPMLEEAAATPATAPAPADEIIPFEEVRQEVARSMVLAAARQQMQAAVDSVEKPMQTYYSEYLVYQTAKEMKDSSAKEPVRPDVKKLAEAAGLPYRATGLNDITSMIQTPLGRSRLQSGEGFAERAFSDNLQLFQPARTIDFDFTAGKISEFLVWKTASRNVFVPKLDEVRQEVIDAWKKAKAEKLAEANAADIAAKLKDATGEDAWKSVVGEAQLPLVVKPALFTWMTSNPQFRPFLSDVPGIDTAGPEFMEKVFATPAGQTVVVSNAPKTAFYAVKVVEFLPDVAELEKRFVADTTQSGPRSIAFTDAETLFADWYAGVEKELDVRWVVPLEQLN